MTDLAVARPRACQRGRIAARTSATKTACSGRRAMSVARPPGTR